MDDSSPEDSLPDCRDRVELPPLRLVHLLFFICVSSIFLAAANSERFAPAPRTKREAADPVYRQIIAVPTALVAAVNATVLVLLCVWTVRGRRAWHEPGHWILLWWFWQIISPWISQKLFTLVRWLNGAETVDELIAFWPLGKGVHVVQSLPFVLVFLALALGWRRVADTWAWRIYFLVMAAGILLTRSVAALPFDWPERARVVIPELAERFVAVNFREMSLVLLLLAMLYDLLPARRRRHWTHWVAVCNSLLGYVLRAVPGVVWQLRHA